MKETFAGFVPNIPEQCEVNMYVTGHKGGDSGHGADTTIEFIPQSGDCHLEVEFEDGSVESFEYPKRVLFSMSGDWEMAGLVFAIIDLGHQLFSDQNIRREYMKYKREG